MFDEGKVSIIVPIYKVEKYIHRCINSIIDQTYAHLEIILVNDGSPDNCGKIADAYGQKDNRIKVIHKENGGLSDARNYGMKEVTGEYTMFVDSDDWLGVHMIETMMTHMQKFKADVVQSAFYYAYDHELQIDQRYFRENDPPAVLDNEQVMHALVVNNKVKNFAWGKLYKTAVIRDIPFKKGVLFEDIYWAHHVMHRVETYLILHQPFYYYYQRDDSIVATYTPRNLDMLAGLKERHHFIAKNYPNLIDSSYKQILKMSLIHYNLLMRKRGIDKEKIHREEIKSYVQANKQALIKAVSEEKDLRFQLFLFLLHPYINMSYLGWRKGLRTLKVLPKPKGLDTAIQPGVKEVVVP